MGEELRSVGFALCLLYGSWTDLKRREIPNGVPLLIVVLALFDFHLWGLGMILPFWILGTWYGSEGLGGGDVKLMLALGVYLGCLEAMMSMVVGLGLALVYGMVVRAGNPKEKGGIPLAPFLSLGVGIGWSIFYGS